jgi:hypothetical protein
MRGGSARRIIRGFRLRSETTSGKSLFQTFRAHVSMTMPTSPFSDIPRDPAPHSSGPGKDMSFVREQQRLEARGGSCRKAATSGRSVAEAQAVCIHDVACLVGVVGSLLRWANLTSAATLDFLISMANCQQHLCVCARWTRLLLVSEGSGMCSTTTTVGYYIWWPEICTNC